MEKVVRVKLSGNNVSHFYITSIDNIKKEDEVLVESDNGIRNGVVFSNILEMDTSLLQSPLKKVIRVVTEKDKKIIRKNEIDSEKAMCFAKKLVKKANLNINIVDCFFSFNREQLLFQFVADSRVDFRLLVKTLAGKYKTRIELRQIGVRDKAKKIGGIGNCGQQLCCNRFLDEFNSVSINMAKNQNIALNPTKINGLCGRLLCCLKYENDTYSENKKELPKVGSNVKVEEGNGKVVNVDVLKKRYIIDIPKKGQVVKYIKDGSN